MNEFIFNQLKAPVYTMSDMVIAQSLHGTAFIAPTPIYTSGGASQIMLTMLTNPSGSGIRAVLDMGTASVNSNAITLVSVYLDPTSTAGTTPITPINLNTSYLSKAPACTVTGGGGPGVSITGGTPVQQLYVVGTLVFSPTAMTLTPGHAVAIVYTFAASGNTGTFATRWYEIPLTGFSS